MITPALPVIGDEFNIPPGFMRQLVMTIFLLGYAQGPFVLAPLSENFGRVTVLQYANVVYLIFNMCCGFAQSRQQMLAFRFLSGLGGAAPQAVRSSPQNPYCKKTRMVFKADTDMSSSATAF
jgi:MFS family permease